MRFTLGFLAGLATAWAALAIWRDINHPVDLRDEWPPQVQIDEKAFSVVDEWSGRYTP